jgi:hypothetical protein
MAKYSKKVMGKEVGQASVYAEPHTMTGKEAFSAKVPNESGVQYTDTMNTSIGNISRGKYAAPKGKIKTRGTGAATKGLYSSTKLG